MFRHVRSKLSKNNVLAQELPVLETVAYNLTDLKRMVDAYGAVYVKPDSRGAGKHVLKVPDEYSITAADKYVHNTDEVFIIQQSVDSLLTVYGVDIGEGNIFDARVIVMLINGEWKRVFMFAKVAGQGRYVSSPERGGMRGEYDSVLHGAGLNKEQAAQLKERLYTLSLRAAKVLAKHYPGLMVIGFDIGIDKELNPWILEANTRPRLDMLMKWTSGKKKERLKGYCKHVHEYPGKEGRQVGIWKSDLKFIY
jgi:hypothetical protein